MYADTGQALIIEPAAVVFERYDEFGACCVVVAVDAGNFESLEPGCRWQLNSVTRAQVQEIAETKMVDLNAHDIDAAMLIIAGTARSMGIEVEG